LILWGKAQQVQDSWYLGAGDFLPAGDLCLAGDLAGSK
jgi:hypothetical protein